MFERQVIRLSALMLSATVTLTLLSGIDSLARNGHAGTAVGAVQWAASAPAPAARPSLAQRATPPRS